MRKKCLWILEIKCDYYAMIFVNTQKIFHTTGADITRFTANLIIFNVDVSNLFSVLTTFLVFQSHFSDLAQVDMSD